MIIFDLQGLSVSRHVFLVKDSWGSDAVILRWHTLANCDDSLERKFWRNA
jgi:hypothetical protein